LIILVTRPKFLVTPVWHY